MLKNSTKITSLLVAAASMATMVPAMAADTTKIADKDGKIYRAISYADGKVYVEGEDIESAKDEDGAFFIDGGKSKEVDDLGSDDEITAVYGTKYVEIAEGDYYVDLTNGKVTDDQLRNEDKEDAASELAKKLRKQDPGRYTDESANEKANIEMDDIKNENDEIWEVPAAPYSEPYYQVNYLRFKDDKCDHVRVGSMGQAKGKDEHGNDILLTKKDGTPMPIPTVYTDGKGKYIDADNDLGNVNVIINKNITANTTTAEALIIDPDASVSKAEAIKFEEVDSKKNRDKTAEVSVDVEHIATLASDKDYIYRLAALHVKYTNLKNHEVYDVTTAGQVVMFGSTKNPVAVKSSEGGRFYVVQKISKETDGDKDDANLPKTTQTYFVSENKDWRKKAKFHSNLAGVTVDVDAATTGIKDGAIETNPTDDDRTIWLNDNEYEDKSGNVIFNEKFANREENTVAYTVADGRLSKYEPQYQTLNDNGSAKDGNEDDKFVVRTFIFKNSNGFYYVDKEKNDDSFEEEDEFATAIDKDGNIWKLDSGKIKKYKNDGSYETMYKCDGGLNELSVYDEKNLIAYNEDDDTYAIVGGKSSTGKYEVEDENKTNTTTTTAQVGWYTNADGSWSYGNADGTKAIGWLQSPTSGLWYYMDANGIMMSNGWVQDGASWYFLGADGAMKTGWVYTGGAWYYLKETAGNKGAMQTGWIQTGGKWYYCNASGAMLSNTTVNGYKLGADGAWIK